MSSVPFTRRTRFGAQCNQCGEELIAPEKSEFVNEAEVRHAWGCPSCGYEFFRSVQIDPKTPMPPELVDEQYLSSLLVA